MVIIEKPEFREDFDCNGNGIEDAFDIAGIIPRGPYPVGEGPRYFTAGDFDGDGDKDIAVSNHGRSSDGTVTILWQRSNRRFEPSEFGLTPVYTRTEDGTDELEWGPPLRPTCIAASDLEGDGDIDLIVAPNYRSVVLIKRNNGSGDFHWSAGDASEAVQVGHVPTCVMVTDLDGDNHPDIVTTSITGQITLLRNDGDGFFESPEHFDPNPGEDHWIDYPVDLTSAYLDDDDDLEVIIGGHFNYDNQGVDFQGAIGVIRNETDSIGATLSQWGAYYKYLYNWEDRLPVFVKAIAVGDILDDDGPNLVVLRSDGIVNVLPNRAGSLTAPEDLLDYPVGTGGLGIGLGDLDNDGDIDIVVPEPEHDTVALLRNRLRRNFSPAIHLPVSGSPTGIYVGNLDSDSRAEIAVSHTGTDDVWILHVRPKPVSLDCNNNGRPDSCDIQDEPHIDADNDGVPDSCDTRTLGGDPRYP
jgi:hypothetical protein